MLIVFSAKPSSMLKRGKQNFFFATTIVLIGGIFVELLKGLVGQQKLKTLKRKVENEKWEASQMLQTKPMNMYQKHNLIF